jgi:branched-chain amino acid transport system ATP-binding protein
MALLEIENVTKSFGGLRAVSDVTLSADEGAITALIGPNGAGKTTLFNVITGFEHRDAGTIRFDGQTIQRQRPWQVAQRGIVRTFQTPVGFPKLTVLENLQVSGSDRATESLHAALLGPRIWGPAIDEINGRAEQVLRELGLWERRDTMLEDLTVGANKLVEFARQLIKRPRILMLDEPASGVDPIHIGKLADLIVGLKERGMAVLVIDHNLSFILGIADYIHVLAAGEVIAAGTPAEISRHPKVMETYLGTAKAEDAA